SAIPSPMSGLEQRLDISIAQTEPSMDTLGAPEPTVGPSEAAARRVSELSKGVDRPTRQQAPTRRTPSTTSSTTSTTAPGSPPRGLGIQPIQALITRSSCLTPSASVRSGSTAACGSRARRVARTTVLDPRFVVRLRRRFLTTLVTLQQPPAAVDTEGNVTGSW